MATLARFHLTITNSDGTILDGATVEVRRESDNGLAALFSDRAGASPMTNSFVAADGSDAGFHVIGGSYKVTATLGAFSRTWRYVAVGTAAEADSTDYVFSTAVRERRSSDLNLYVGRDGSDSNTGLTDTAGGRLLTIVAALLKATQNYDYVGLYSWKIWVNGANVGDGTYTENIITKDWVGYGIGGFNQGIVRGFNGVVTVNGATALATILAAIAETPILFEKLKVGNANASGIALEGDDGGFAAFDDITIGTIGSGGIGVLSVANSGRVLFKGATATVSITIASPGVVSWTAHGFIAEKAVVFSTTGALPTGLVAGTTYYVVAAGLAANSFRLSATPGGAAINTSGSQSGVHTGRNVAITFSADITAGTGFYVRTNASCIFQPGAGIALGTGRVFGNALVDLASGGQFNNTGTAVFGSLGSSTVPYRINYDTNAEIDDPSLLSTISGAGSASATPKSIGKGGSNSITSSGARDNFGILSARNSAQFDKTSNTTLSDITGMSVTVAAAGVYSFEAILFTTSNVAGGVKAAIAGTATATAIAYEALVFNAAALAAQTRAAALAAAVGGVTAVTVALIRISGLITVNAAGTLTVQFAQNASNGAASSVLVGSHFRVNQIG